MKCKEKKTQSKLRKKKKSRCSKFFHWLKIIVVWMLQTPINIYEYCINACSVGLIRRMSVNCNEHKQRAIKIKILWMIMVLRTTKSLESYNLHYASLRCDVCGTRHIVIKSMQLRRSSLTWQWAAGCSWKKDKNSFYSRDFLWLMCVMWWDC